MKHALFAAFLALTSCGRSSMSQSGTPNPSTTSASAAPDPSREAALPVEPSSRSELLSATHVFSIEIVSVQSSPWISKSDGTQSRSLDLDIKLLETLKGQLTTPVGEVFEASVDQIQGSPRLPPVGIWSALEPEAKARYLVVANGLPTSAAKDVLAERALVRISDGAAAAEVHLAKEGEGVFRAALSAPANAGKEPDLAASRALLDVALNDVARAGDLFGRYLLARITPSFVRSPDRPVAPLVALLTAPGASFGLRAEISALLDQVAVELGGDPVFLQAVANGYLQLLVDPGAQRLHHRLVQVSLYLLVFPKDDGKARAPSSQVVPDAAARARYKAALAAFPGDRSAKLSAWLD